ncbi:hypothetical protein [Paraburkholderia guartelaensis]|uniref:hypothetical protein n=1 Tax=Paraburkholderia guartelaensis TaxID=2546446 RepID=UPI002AB7ABE7|nr:hypothetical protein [Paraburkholderia guartelaensis]
MSDAVTASANCFGSQPSATLLRAIGTFLFVQKTPLNQLIVRDIVEPDIVCERWFSGQVCLQGFRLSD